ncbi:acylphosphatase-2 [Diabrotica virgifera virgifera]|uniref:acylphosphatase n=1 Tax=Diabrotica virgifera virgifera TaxID=50390 RepID=A0A6P7G9I3_DIAVI|nr:acylphosphatase-2 [Diabrotica virgifera virgifera]
MIKLFPFNAKLLICAIIIIFTSCTRYTYTANMSSETLLSVDFEVFGRVQGVFFRKYTEKEAKRLNLKGWCMNTKQDTVKGIIEGPTKNVEEMKLWLQETGSPSSRIDKAVFSNQKTINQYTYDSFKIKR